MNKLMLNQLKINLTISTHDSRLLIAEYKSKDDGQNSNIVSSVVEKNGKFIIPGSTLKGNFRNRAEYIANFLNAQMGACQIFSTDMDAPVLSKDLFCGCRFEIRKKTQDITVSALPNSKDFFRDACPICQTFGHTFLKSRIYFSDFMQSAVPGRKTQMHIAVDRATGSGVKGKLYELPFLTQASFNGTICLDNFQVWQLGLIGLLLQDFDDGLIRLGHKQSAGFGRMKIDKLEVEIKILNHPDNLSTRINGIMALNENVWKDYGRQSLPEATQSDDFIDLETTEWSNELYWQVHRMSLERSEPSSEVSKIPFFVKSRGKAINFLQNFSVSESMTTPALKIIQASEVVKEEH